MSLFEATEKKSLDAAKPLAARMRPQNLDQFIGQQQFLGEGKLLRKLVDADRLGSVIFFGPPGTCLLYTSPSPRDGLLSRMPSSA